MVVPSKVACTPCTLMPEGDSGAGTGKRTVATTANMVVVVK